MRKLKLPVAALMIAGSSLLFTSCIGSFALTNKVIDWNRHIGNKFVNELVFLAFWILPVYEVTALADVIVLNSVEFWSGNNPVTASATTVETDHGRYSVVCDGNGYDITNESTGESVRLNFDSPSQTWSVVMPDGVDLPFMTMIDDSHVKMIAPDGSMKLVELSAQGLMAYQSEAGIATLAAR